MISCTPGNEDQILSDLCLTLSSEEPPDWNLLLEADPDSDFFHTTVWAKSLCKYYPGMKAIFMTARSGEKLVGGMVAFQHGSSGSRGLGERLDSGFDGTSGGPIPLADLPPSQQENIFLFLLSQFLKLRSRVLGVGTISLNAGHENRFGHILQEHESFSRRRVVGAVVDLTGGSEEVSVRQMSKNKRNERNRGLRSGAEIVITQDPRLVAEYYPIYESASAHWRIDPVPLAFLQDLLVSSSGQVFFVAIVFEGRVIGGHLNLHQGNRVIAWNGVTDPAFSRTQFPATLGVWGDIEEACRRQAKWLDMGASGGVVSLEGFKKYFGAILEERALYVNESLLFKTTRKIRTWLQSLSQSSVVSSDDNQPERWHDKAKPASDKISQGDS